MSENTVKGIPKDVVVCDDASFYGAQSEKKMAKVDKTFGDRVHAMMCAIETAQPGMYDSANLAKRAIACVRAGDVALEEAAKAVSKPVRPEPKSTARKIYNSFLNGATKALLLEYWQPMSTFPDGGPVMIAFEFEGEIGTTQVDASEYVVSITESPEDLAWRPIKSGDQ